MLPTEPQIETFWVDHYKFASHEGFQYETSLVQGKDTYEEFPDRFELFQVDSKTLTKISKPIFLEQKRSQEMKRRIKKPGECLVCDNPAKETSRFCRLHEREVSPSGPF